MFLRSRADRPQAQEAARPSSPREPLFGGRIALRGRSLRTVTARGTIVNGAFQVFLTTLGMLRGVLIAAFLTAAEYGVWGIVFITLTTMMWLKQVGVADKFVQQSEEDQELAFQKALTLELILTGGFVAVFAACVPLFALIYGQPEIVAPALVMGLALVISAFQFPLWAYFRRMEFVRQRSIQALDPVVGFVVTIGLAIMGLGYWSIVLGVLAGALAGSAAAVLLSPVALKLRYDRGTARQYLSFSWPLVIAGGSSLVIAQGAVITGEAVYGLAGAGALTLAATISQYVNRVDGILTGTMYPAICAVADRTDLLFESFVKSNRLALIWGVPFGVGISLFAVDLVYGVLGDQWESAVVLLQAFGLTGAAGHIGFNWDAFYRARGDTRPIAVWSVVTMLSFVAVPLPLLIFDGFTGFAIGMGVMTVVSLAVRGLYLTRLFPGFKLARHAARAIAPTVPAVAAVLLMRAVEGGERGAALAGLELAVYLAVTAIATLAFERRLLAEVLSYLRGRAAADARPAT